MSALPPQKFSVTPAVFATLTTEANKQGIAITGDQGEATQHGVTISWAYNRITWVLTLDCLKHSGLASLVSGSSIAARITALVTDAGGTARPTAEA